jgi:hypothetical protein
MSTDIKGVRIIACAYVWNNKDVTYIVSTCGDTSSCQEPYVCYDPSTGYDNMDTKMYPHPDIINFLFTQAPIIDTHNKLRQFSLSVEKQWPTKCCWKKLLMGYLGMSIVNMQQLYSYCYPGVPRKDLTVNDFARTIAKDVNLRKRTTLPVPLCKTQNNLLLRRIADANGNTTKAVTPKQADKRSKGSTKQLTCFICKRYKEKYVYATTACPKCGTALCQQTERTPTCLHEHLTTDNHLLRCNGRQKVRFPKECRLW